MTDETDAAANGTANSVDRDERPEGDDVATSAEAASSAAAADDASDDYRVELEVFSGPLDLLLHLIKKDEIDIYDIPISSILDQYMAHLKVLELMELDDVGDFLVMAANLMLIKARMLVPNAVEIDLEDDEIDDPRAELVQKLLEYQRFKEAASDLSVRAVERSRQFGRGRDRKLPPVDPGDGPLKVKVELWDLVEAFAKIVREVGAGRTIPEVTGEEQRPMAFFMEEIVGRIRRVDGCYLDDLFVGAKTRSEMVSYFMALLELMRQRVLDAVQQGPFGRIAIERNANPRDGLTYDAAGAEESFAPTSTEADAESDAAVVPTETADREAADPEVGGPEVGDREPGPMPGADGTFDEGVDDDTTGA